MSLFHLSYGQLDTLRMTSCFVHYRWPKYAKSARFYDSQSELRDGISVTRRVLRSLIPFVMKCASKYSVAQLDAVGYVKQSPSQTQIPNYQPINAYIQSLTNPQGRVRAVRGHNDVHHRGRRQDDDEPDHRAQTRARAVRSS